MRQTPAMRWTLVVIGALAFAGVLLALLLLINSDLGFVGCSGFTPFGWIIPLIAGVILGLVVMLLMNHNEDAEDPRDLNAATCAACGGQIIDEWRLCPHCGELRSCDVDLPAQVGMTHSVRGL